jgi:hypothetical protein
MTRLGVVPLTVLLCFVMVLLASARQFSAEPWQTYVDNTYQVMLRFPGEWKKDAVYYDRPYFGTERQLNKVSRGFFQLLAT